MITCFGLWGCVMLCMETWYVILIIYNIDMYYDEVSLVGKRHGMMRMLMASTYILGLHIESGSGLFIFVMSIWFIMHVLYDDFSYEFCVYELLILSLSLDASMVTLVNPTHIWIKGVIHRYHMDEGEVWHSPCHNLIALPMWPKLKVNDYLVPRGSRCVRADWDNRSWIFMRGAQ
jgi:hypothetical protein